MKIPPTRDDQIRRKSERLAKLSEIYSTEIFAANRKRKIFSLNTQLMTKPTNSDTSVPKTFKKAMESAEADEWKQAADAELIGLKKTNCYTEVDLPPGKKGQLF